VKILLLEHPREICPERCNDVANTPLSSCLLTGYTAAVLRWQGYAAEIVEGYLDGLSYEAIAQKVAAFGPAVLGVHLVYQWKADQKIFGFLQKLKQADPSLHITVYGFYPTFAFAEILRTCPGVDSVILGEPETTFAELAGAFSRRAGFRKIPGLAWREETGGEAGRVGYLRRKPVADLDRLPFPVRTEAMFRLPEVNLQGSRGCYGGCTFCYINPFYGQGSCWRGRSPENIAEEIDGIISERGKKEYYFVDPNFFGPGEAGQKRALRLASLLKTRDVRFGIEARVNDIREETVAALVEAGLRQVFLGLESGSDRALRRMEKLTTVAQNERALKILRKHGIEPDVGFIMFEPDASLADVRSNFEFLQRNDLLNNLPVTANVLYHPQFILQGTPAYQALREAGRLEVSSFSAYEGIPSFADRRVAVLARIMGRIAAFLFRRLAGFWSGRLEEPEGAREKYAQMNRLLVERFASLLKMLEAGEDFSPEREEAVVQEAEEELARVFSPS